MKIIPAIDIIEGSCVRLTKGNYATRKIYNKQVQKNFCDITDNVFYYFRQFLEDEIVIAGYHPYYDEVNCLYQMDEVKYNFDNIQLSQPVVQSIKESRMIFRAFNDDNDLKKGKYDILVPKKKMVNLVTGI